MKLKNSKIFWGSIPQTPLAASAFRTASGLKLGGAWVRRKSSVPTLCPGIGCVLATPLDSSCRDGVQWTCKYSTKLTHEAYNHCKLKLSINLFLVGGVHKLVCVTLNAKLMFGGGGGGGGLACDIRMLLNCSILVPHVRWSY